MKRQRVIAWWPRKLEPEGRVWLKPVWREMVMRDGRWVWTYHRSEGYGVRP